MGDGGVAGCCALAAHALTQTKSTAAIREFNIGLSPNIVLNLIRRTLLLDELAPLPVGSEGSIVGSNENIDKAETDFATATCDAANDRSGSTAALRSPKSDLRSSPKSGLKSAIAVGPFRCHKRKSRGPHSITSSASASNLEGTTMPSAFAVLRLMTNVNLLACSTGDRRAWDH